MIIHFIITVYLCAAHGKHLGNNIRDRGPNLIYVPSDTLKGASLTNQSVGGREGNYSNQINQTNTDQGIANIIPSDLNASHRGTKNPVRSSPPWYTSNIIHDSNSPTIDVTNANTPDIIKNGIGRVELTNSLHQPEDNESNHSSTEIDKVEVLQSPNNLSTKSIYEERVHKPKIIVTFLSTSRLDKNRSEPLYIDPFQRILQYFLSTFIRDLTEPNFPFDRDERRYSSCGHGHGFSCPRCRASKKEAKHDEVLNLLPENSTQEQAKVLNNTFSTPIQTNKSDLAQKDYINDGRGSDKIITNLETRDLELKRSEEMSNKMQVLHLSTENSNNKESKMSNKMQVLNISNNKESNFNTFNAINGSSDSIPDFKHLYQSTFPNLTAALDDKLIDINQASTNGSIRLGRSNTLSAHNRLSNNINIINKSDGVKSVGILKPVDFIDSRKQRDAGDSDKSQNVLGNEGTVISTVDEQQITNISQLSSNINNDIVMVPNLKLQAQNISLIENASRLERQINGVEKGASNLENITKDTPPAVSILDRNEEEKLLVPRDATVRQTKRFIPITSNLKKTPNDSKVFIQSDLNRQKLAEDFKMLNYMNPLKQRDDGKLLIRRDLNQQKMDGNKKLIIPKTIRSQKHQKQTKELKNQVLLLQNQVNETNIVYAKVEDGVISIHNRNLQNQTNDTNYSKVITKKATPLIEVIDVKTALNESVNLQPNSKEKRHEAAKIGGLTASDRGFEVNVASKYSYTTPDVAYPPENTVNIVHANNDGARIEVVPSNDPPYKINRSALSTPTEKVTTIHPPKHLKHYFLSNSGDAEQSVAAPDNSDSNQNIGMNEEEKSMAHEHLFDLYSTNKFSLDSSDLKMDFGVNLLDSKVLSEYSIRMIERQADWNSSNETTEASGDGDNDGDFEYPLPLGEEPQKPPLLNYSKMYYFFTVTIPVIAVVGIIIGGLCYCLRSSGYCCHLFLTDPTVEIIKT